MVIENGKKQMAEHTYFIKWFNGRGEPRGSESVSSLRPEWVIERGVGLLRAKQATRCRIEDHLGNVVFG